MKYLKSLAVTTIALGGVIAMGAGITHAASTPNGQVSPMKHLVTAISQKFNLRETDVQKVFDEEHAQMEATHGQKSQEQLKTRLDQAVKDGKLTQTQEDAIIAKQAEEKTFMESLKGKTRDERDAALKTHKETLKTWATTNNIPEEYLLRPMGGPRGGHRGMMKEFKGGMGGMRGQGPRDENRTPLTN